MGYCAGLNLADDSVLLSSCVVVMRSMTVRQQMSTDGIWAPPLLLVTLLEKVCLA